MSGGDAVFAYGSLLFPEVMEVVAGRRLDAAPAVLEEYQRYRLRNAVYPGLLPEAGSRTEGVLWRGADAQVLARLDAFEGDFYDRLELRVEAGKASRAWVYVVRASEAGRLVREPWDPDAFAALHLNDYLLMCKRFAQGLQASSFG